ncbi:MAG: nucleotidyl transferase AbiEii/AbiGii toxin family protein [Planctomycetia bacterium]|nr:nucleotidyl transferase AbiEii/AbiGii toxin family protein [Planctomycetia bacterium]
MAFISLRLASCADLAAMKFLAVAQRGTKKDFIDIHALSRRMPLTRMLDCYQRRFNVTDTSRILAGLCFFDDAEAEPMPFMLMPLDWETVKRDLLDMVRRLVRQ